MGGFVYSSINSSSSWSISMQPVLTKTVDITDKSKIIETIIKNFFICPPYGVGQVMAESKS